MSTYAVAHGASVERAFVRAAPRSLPELMAWYLSAWAEEIPDRLHTPGVWRDYGSRGVGGSLLGSPRLHDAFRDYLEGSPYRTDALPGEDERNAVYVRPVHRALARMAGAHGGGPLTNRLGVRPFMARFLFSVACSGGDWQAAASRFGIPPQVAPIYTQSALWRLWSEYEREPQTLT